MTRNSLRAVALFILPFAIAATRSAPAQTYEIVDTGPKTCYDNSRAIAPPEPGESFYGQDGQIDGNLPDYSVSDDELTVRDLVTGLTWTKRPDWNGDGDIDADDKMSYADALAYVETLNDLEYGGFDDWRLPHIKELYSLIDYRGTDPDPMASSAAGLRPFIDTSVFDFGYGDVDAEERIIDSQWATRSLYVSTVMNGQQAMFGVNFADGRIKGYPAYGGPGGVDKTYYVRYCRGNPAYGSNRFADNGDGTVTDSSTGLMWQQADNGEGVDWEDALSWAQEMNDADYLGHNDWRLPNAKELHSILDYTRSPETHGSAAIDPVFDVTGITNEAGEDDYPFYWSSTTFLRFDGNASNAVYVAFGRGLGTMDGSTIIDVHGAGCQRSDPKTGSPDDYPQWGHGPQGDVQRVFNYVRLVRDAELSSDVGARESEPGGDVVLRQIRPNPFAARTTIELAVPQRAHIRLTISDLAGRTVATLADGRTSAGTHRFDWNAEEFADGVYVCTVSVDSVSRSRKIIRME